MFGEFLVSVRYVWRDVWKRPRDFWIAVVTVIMASTALICGYTLVEKGALVFVKLTESIVGEYDLMLTPAPGSIVSAVSPNGTMPGSAAVSRGAPLLLNNSAIDAAIRANASDVSRGSAARWVVVGRALNRFSSVVNVTAVVVAFDEEHEREIGLGRGWDRRPLVDGEAYASQALLYALGIEAGVGQRVVLDFNAARLAASFGLDPGRLESAIEDAFEEGVRQALNGTNIVLNLSNDTQVQLVLEGLLNASIPLPLVDALIAAIGRNGTLPLSGLLSDHVLHMVFRALFPQLATLQAQVELTVVDGVAQPNGKWPQVLGNVVAVSSRWLPLTLRELIPPNLRQNAALLDRLFRDVPGYRPPVELTPDAVLMGIPVQDYAMQVVVPFRNRLDAYLQGEGADRNRLITHWSNSVADAVGWAAAVQATTPINRYMVGLDILRALLQSLYNICLVVLFVYCGMVVYALMVTNAEAKTYEFGMVRALGMRHRALIGLMSIQALFYAIPAVVAAVVLAFASNVPIQAAVAYYTDTPIDFSLSWIGLAVGVAVGLSMPLVANIVPIRRALSQTLRDALDVYHSSSTDSIVTVQRLEELGVSPLQTVGAMVVTGMCFVYLYLYPWAFQYLRFGLLFFLTDTIFIALTAGLSMVAAVVQQRLERVTMYILMLPSRHLRPLIPLVAKMLAAHGTRNRKTAIMITLVGSFVVFSGVSLKLETLSAENGYRVLVGSNLLFFSLFSANPLDHSGMAGFLDTQTPAYRAAAAANHTLSPAEDRYLTAAVAEYATFTYTMAELPGTLFTQVSNAAGRPWSPVFLVGVDEEYLHAIYDDLTVIQKYDAAFDYNHTRSGRIDFIGSLYRDAGRARVAMDQLLPADMNFSSVLPHGAAPSAFSAPPQPDPASAYTGYLDVVISKADEGGEAYPGDPLALRVGYRMHTWDYDPVAAPTVTYVAKARASVSKLPGFIFSWITHVVPLIGQPMIVSMPDYQRIQRDVWRQRKLLHERYGWSVDSSLLQEPSASPARRALLVRYVDTATPAQRQYIVNQLRSYVPNDSTLASDSTDLLGIIDTVMALVQLFFMSGIVIADVLCFFVLWVTCYSNVHHNAWEFAVVRALGLTKVQVISIYVFEMLVVCLTGLVSGCLIGTVLSITLALQNDLWGDWPFHFYFPVAIFGFLVFLTSLIAIIGSYIPAKHLANQQVAQVIKGSS